METDRHVLSTTWACRFSIQKDTILNLWRKIEQRYWLKFVKRMEYRTLGKLRDYVYVNVGVCRVVYIDHTSASTYLSEFALKIYTVR